MPESKYEYIYDPDHKKHPGEGYMKTENGWSKGGTSVKDKNGNPLSEEEKQRHNIAVSLFTHKQMTAPRVRNSATNEKDYFDQANQAQEFMMSSLDKGHEKDWLGPDARHIRDLTPEELKKPGPILLTAPVKSSKRAKEKVDTDFDGDWGRLTDGVRCSVVVDSYDELPGVIKRFEKSGCKIVGKPKNRLAKRLKSGYADILCNAEFGNGFVGEVQFHLKEMLNAKQFGGGHKLYETERSLCAKCGNDLRRLKKEDKLAMKQCLANQKKLYDGAYRKTKIRKAAVEDNEFPKYFLSNSEFSYYLYGDDEMVAFCIMDNNPKFWTGKRWKEATSFTEFCDKAVEISLREFKARAAEQGVSFK